MNRADWSSVIAIHGMGAHPDDTWCQPRDPEADTKSPENYVNWLTDPRMLPTALPNARIMRYGYMSAWFGEEKVRTRIMEISSKFLHALADAREVGGRLDSSYRHH